MNDLTLGSLYSGAIDAFAYGATKVGIKVKWHVENDSRAYPYLKTNYPNSNIYQHDTVVGKRNLEWVNIIAGGDPCQPSSTAGLRKGKTDDRYRWPEMFRIVSELRPDWVINENVAGSISNMVLDQKITDLESIGYSWGAFNLPAISVGAHHIRQRVFLIATNTNVQGWRELLCIDPRTIFEATQQPYSLGAQGNAFLQFEKSVVESPLFSMDDGLSDNIFRLGATGNSIISPIPIILLTAIKETYKLKS